MDTWLICQRISVTSCSTRYSVGRWDTNHIFYFLVPGHSPYIWGIPHLKSLGKRLPPTMKVEKARYLLSCFLKPPAVRAQVHGLGSAYLKLKLVTQSWGSAKSSNKGHHLECRGSNNSSNHPASNSNSAANRNFAVTHWAVCCYGTMMLRKQWYPYGIELQGMIVAMVLDV